MIRLAAAVAGYVAGCWLLAYFGGGFWLYLGNLAAFIVFAAALLFGRTRRGRRQS